MSISLLERGNRSSICLCVVSEFLRERVYKETLGLPNKSVILSDYSSNFCSSDQKQVKCSSFFPSFWLLARIRLNPVLPFFIVLIYFFIKVSQQFILFINHCNTTQCIIIALSYDDFQINHTLIDLSGWSEWVRVANIIIFITNIKISYYLLVMSQNSFWQRQPTQYNSSSINEALRAFRSVDLADSETSRRWI